MCSMGCAGSAALVLLGTMVVWIFLLHKFYTNLKFLGMNAYTFFVFLWYPKSAFVYLVNIKWFMNGMVIVGFLQKFGWVYRALQYHLDITIF